MSTSFDLKSGAINDVYTQALDSPTDCPANPDSRRCFACRSLGANTVYRTLNENDISVVTASEIVRAKQAISETSAVISESFPTSMIDEQTAGLTCGDRRVRVVEAAVELASRIVAENSQQGL